MCDQDESYQGDEDLDSFAPPSSSSMVPVPEVSTSWGSSFHAFSTSSSYRPLSPTFVVRSSGAMRPLLRCSSQAGAVRHLLFYDSLASSKKTSSTHSITRRLPAPRSSPSLPDWMPDGAPSPFRTPLPRTGRVRLPACVFTLAFRQFCEILRVFSPPPTLMDFRWRGWGPGSRPLIVSCPSSETVSPSGGCFCGNPEKTVLSSAKFFVG